MKTNPLACPLIAPAGGEPSLRAHEENQVALAPLVAGIKAPLQSGPEGDKPGLHLLDGHLRTLFGADQNLGSALASLQIRDLVLSALALQGAVRDLGINAARQRAVLDMIRRRAGERGLNPAGVASQAGISVRYLHRLLEPTGRTFSQHLLEQRLERAAAELRNPERRQKIAEIAFASGFSDISHFNRSFRRAFGDTPYGVRVRAARMVRKT